MTNSEGTNHMFHVNDEVTIGFSGQVVYGIAKIVGDEALVLKIGMTRQKTARTLRRIKLSELRIVR